ncbi:sensor histidine kinase [Novosphingobium tardum]|uniref:histidine kinase n=1 Tax=Novosphingobium tardum TaxID=1538021 RepID=A0ABV8RNE1_9SPHN
MPENRSARAMRLARLDLVGERKGGSALAVQVAVALAALLGFLASRGFVDLWVRGTAPFAVIYPWILLATLTGRLRAGLIAWLTMTAVVASGFMVPGRWLTFADPNNFPRTIVNGIVGFLIVLITDAARRQAFDLLAEREMRIAERDMLLEEVDHRLKNNLAMLSGLLALQVRETTNDEVKEVLTRAAARLQSISDAYESLRYEPGSITVVDAEVLLNRLCASLRGALGLDRDIRLEVEAESCLISRDRAAALALLVNELVTNAVKHAFRERGSGTIRVSLTRLGHGSASLVIADDGRGLHPGGAATGKGHKLLQALAEMAGASLEIRSGADGTRFLLELKQLP